MSNLITQISSTEAIGTSFFGSVFIATVSEVECILSQPTSKNNDGRDKVNFQWVRKNKYGAVFTVYDWKEYRPLGENEEIEWHIGGHNEFQTDEARYEIEDALKLLRK